MDTIEIQTANYLVQMRAQLVFARLAREEINDKCDQAYAEPA